MVRFVIFSKIKLLFCLFNKVLLSLLLFIVYVCFGAFLFSWFALKLLRSKKTCCEFSANRHSRTFHNSNWYWLATVALVSLEMQLVLLLLCRLSLTRFAFSFFVFLVINCFRANIFFSRSARSTCGLLERRRKRRALRWRLSFVVARIASRNSICDATTRRAVVWKILDFFFWPLPTRDANLRCSFDACTARAFECDHVSTRRSLTRWWRGAIDVRPPIDRARQAKRRSWNDTWRASSRNATSQRSASRCTRSSFKLREVLLYSTSGTRPAKRNSAVCAMATSTSRKWSNRFFVFQNRRDFALFCLARCFLLAFKANAPSLCLT